MKWLFVIFFVSFIFEAQAKEYPVIAQNTDTITTPSIHPAAQHSLIERIFQKVEYGLQNNAVDKFKDELGEIVSITMSSGEHGYYSADQAAAVLTGFFSARRLISFTFTRMHEKDSAPYATGRFIYIQKGMQRSAQVYVSLTQQNSRWVINQFNIY